MGERFSLKSRVNNEIKPGMVYSDRSKYVLKLLNHKFCLKTICTRQHVQQILGTYCYDVE